MKNPKITLTKDGLLLIDAPEKPKYGHGEVGINYLLHKYTKALEKSIKEGVKFKDHNSVAEPLLYEMSKGKEKFHVKLEQGKLYDIPISYQAKVKIVCDEPCGGTCGECNHGKKVFFLEPLIKQEPDIEKRKIEIKEKLGVYSTTVLSTPAIEQKEPMTDLEKEMHKEYQSRPRTMRRVDDAIKAASIVAERHIAESGGWISVKERLPDVLDIRIKLIDGSELNVWTQSDGDYWSEAIYKFIPPEKVTHWMPLPKTPQVNQNSNDR